MIAIVARFETDGDYLVDNKAAGLTSPPDDDYFHGGLFLCANTDEAAAVLLRVIQGVKDEGEYFGGVYLDHIFSWLTSSVNEALHLLRKKSEILQFGWLRLASGNYDGTLLFVQEVTDWRGAPKKPVYQDNTADCPYTAPYCPACGHILIDSNGDNFKFCPDCGQRIKWDG